MSVPKTLGINLKRRALTLGRDEKVGACRCGCARGCAVCVSRLSCLESVWELCVEGLLSASELGR